MVCEKEEISPCIKKWGPLKESGKDTATLAQPEALVRVSTPEPSRQIPTEIDAFIGHREALVLQYVYSHHIRYPLSIFAQSYGLITNRLTSFYGPSIKRSSLRFSILAVSAGLMLAHGLHHFEEQLDEYSTLACRALREKNVSSFDVEDYFVIYFLFLAECHRFETYFRHSRSPSDISRMWMYLQVHIKGLLAIMHYFGDRLRSAVIKMFGLGTWSITLAILAGHVCVVDGAE